jgi:hypothetical protein
MELKMDKSVNSGIEFDKMNFTCLQWRNLIFWGIPSKQNSEIFVEFQAFLISKQIMYQMKAVKPSLRSHFSAWTLDIVRFGDVRPCSRVMNHEILKNSSFSELFSVMGVLIDEQENPNLFEYISKREFQRIQRKFKKWSHDLPEWLQPTIEATNARIAKASAAVVKE